jgi:hypothetical protein
MIPDTRPPKLLAPGTADEAERQRREKREKDAG